MAYSRLVRRRIRIIFCLSLLVVAVLFRDKLQALYSYYYDPEKDPKLTEVKPAPKVLTESQLAEFSGVMKNRLYLSIMGTVFDVTKGLVHYGEGGSYHYFVGKDGSRAFITGNFKDDSVLKDHVLDLSCDELYSMANWKNTFKQKYKKVGVLEGRYYDSKGKPTLYAKQLGSKIKQCKIEKEVANKEDQKYPPCNMEWSADKGSRVWCSKSSGGIARSWEGVPRQLFTPGDAKPRCVCVNLYKDHTQALLKEFTNCNADSTSCMVE